MQQRISEHPQLGDKVLTEWGSAPGQYPKEFPQHQQRRSHRGGSAAAFRQLSTRPVSGAATDGTYYLDTTNHLIYVYTQKFSTYAIGYTVPSSGGGSSGSGGSSGGTRGTVKSSKTADAGISLYAGMAVASLLGSGVVFSRKRKDF